MNHYALPAVALVTLATVAIGAYGLRFARTTSDFLVASRAVSPRWNAAAISGEYLSAASFLGVAGLVLLNGVDMLWYPVGFAAGYLALLLFAVAPTVAGLRPFGIALPWVLLGVAAYPFLFAVGATYVWLSERTEREFAELVDRKGRR